MGHQTIPDVAIITPTLGRHELMDCVGSVAHQTYKVHHIIVSDADSNLGPLKTCLGVDCAYWPEKVGGGTWYANRIIAASPFLVTEPYIGFSNDDDWFKPNHVFALMDAIKRDNLDWAYSHRSIYSHAGEYLFDDECEALGEAHDVWNMPGHRFVDTCAIIARTEAFRTIAPIYCSDQFGRDRDAYALLKAYFPKFAGVHKPTMCFRLGSGPGSASREYFEQGNLYMKSKYGKVMPWNRGK